MSWTLRASCRANAGRVRAWSNVCLAMQDSRALNFGPSRCRRGCDFRMAQPPFFFFIIFQGPFARLRSSHTIFNHHGIRYTSQGSKRTASNRRQMHLVGCSTQRPSLDTRMLSQGRKRLLISTTFAPLLRCILLIKKSIKTHRSLWTFRSRQIDLLEASLCRVPRQVWIQRLS